MELGSCVLLSCNLLKLEDIDNIKHKLNDSLTTDTVFGSTFKETPLYQKCFLLSMDESGPLGFEKMKKMFTTTITTDNRLENAFQHLYGCWSQPTAIPSFETLIPKFYCIYQLICT